MLLLSFTAGWSGAEEKIDARQPAGSAEASRNKTEVALEAEIALGYDSNVYEAPGAPYIDYAATGGPVSITPVRHSGYFLPVGVKARYAGDAGPSANVIADYRFDQTTYLASENRNADEWTHRIKAGLEFVFGRKGKREDTLYLGPVLTKRNRTYYDHDTGLDKTTAAGDDIEERYSYDGVGFEAVLKKRTSAVQFSLYGEYESRDYDDPVTVSQYDNTRNTVGGDLEFRLAKPLEVKLRYEWSSVDYDDRHARNAQGQLFASAPLLQYTYNQYGVSLRARLSSDATAYLDYDRTNRADAYVGYNDYVKDEFGIRFIYTGIDRTRLRMKLASWTRDYPNAFAFDKAGQPQKTYDGIDALVTGEYRFTKAWSVWAEYRYEKQNSTDQRYDYDLYQAMAGVSWQL